MNTSASRGASGAGSTTRASAPLSHRLSSPPLTHPNRRYAFYTHVLSELGCPRGCGVVFGHHSGDVAENVLTSLCKRTSSLLSASGMAPASRGPSGVLVWRPLLAFPKRDIFAFASSFGVPYFRDTTPAWSTRGAVRSTALPALEAVFGAGVGDSLACAGADADACSTLIASAFLDPFWAACAVSPAAVTFDAARWVDCPLLFWREALRRVCHALGAGAPAQPAVGELLTRLRRHAAAAAAGALPPPQTHNAAANGCCAHPPRSPPGAPAPAPPAAGGAGRPCMWLPLKRGVLCCVDGTVVTVFAPGVFPPPRDARAPPAQAPPTADGAAPPPQQQPPQPPPAQPRSRGGASRADPPAPPGARLRLGREHAARFGPWEVSCARVGASDAPPRPHSRVTVASLSAGSFEYDLPMECDADDDDLCLRVAYAPRMPPFAGMPRWVRAALPLAVCGPEGGADGGQPSGGGGGDEGEPGGGGGGSGGDGDGGGDGALPDDGWEVFRSRRWPASPVGWIRVRVSFLRGAPSGGAGVLDE